MGPDMNLKEWGHPGQLLNSLQVRLSDLEVHLPTAECYDVIAFCNGRSSRAPALPCRSPRAPFHESTDQTSKVPLRLPMKSQHSARVENTPTHSTELIWLHHKQPHQPERPMPAPVQSRKGRGNTFQRSLRYLSMACTPLSPICRFPPPIPPPQ